MLLRFKVTAIIIFSIFLICSKYYSVFGETILLKSGEIIMGKIRGKISVESKQGRISIDPKNIDKIYNEGDYDFERILSSSKSSDKVVVLELDSKAAPFLLSGKDMDGMKYFQDLSNRFPHLTYINLLLGIFSYRIGCYNKALYYFDIFSSCKTNSIIHHVYLGLSLKALGKKVDSEKEFYKALQLLGREGTIKKAILVDIIRSLAGNKYP